MLIDSHDDTRVEMDIRVDIQPYRGIWPVSSLSKDIATPHPKSNVGCRV